MKKPVILFLLVLLALVAAVALRKSRPVSVDTPGTTAEQTVAEKANVQRFWTLYRQATDQRMAGRWAQAAEAYRQALALNDAHEDALYYLGHMYLELGAFAQAHDAWKRLARLNPNSARAHTQLGNLYSCLEQEAFFDLEAAEAAFARALEINKEETGPLLHLGQIALIQGNLPEARHYFEAVTGSNYKSVAAYFLNGYVAWKEGDGPQASALLAQAVEHARPEEPPQGVPGEGDTKSGTAPLVAQASRCRAFQPFIDDLTRHQAAHPPIDQPYQQLDAFLVHARTKIVAPG